MKILTFRCADCDEVFRFSVGASPAMSTWQDTMAMINDEKETNRLVDAYMKVSRGKSEMDMQNFAFNWASVLTNINYDAVGVKTEALFDENARAASAPVFNPKVAEHISYSYRKWADILSRDGFVAFKALYACSKTRVLQQGLFMRMRWTDEKKKSNVVEYSNRCEKCGNSMIMINDNSMGFSQEGQPTTCKCSKCQTGTLIAEHTLFNK